MAKVYISGKITGLPFEDAYKLFEEAEQEVIKLGGVPVNPTKLLEQIEGWTWEDFMEKDLGFLLRCDGIYMLRNWASSKGARCEYALAKELGLTIEFQK